MPRPRLPARLWLTPEREGRSRLWVILDGGEQFSTGCGMEDRAGAERALQRHIDAKSRPAKSNRAPDEVSVAEVLNVYLKDCADENSRPKELAARVGRLLNFWGTRSLADVGKHTCKAYWQQRPRAAARRELEDLRAAIRHFAAEGYVPYTVPVHLPPKSLRRERWLTRKELAAMIWAAWTYREVQRGKVTDRRPLRHVARFILVAYYTGSRAGAVCAASLMQFDLDRGVFYRRPEGERETNKRRPPVKLNGRIVAHIRRWIDKGISQQHLVEWGGRPLGRLKRSFASAVAKAKLETEGPSKVTPHVLRHTAATHLMQRGISLEDASQFLGMSVETLREFYWHHHPDYQREAAEALARK
ncbi:MAG: tyrosine-type recombinase/integrase [Alsobacter sp.]